MSKARGAWQLVRNLFQEFIDDNALELAAAVSFYALLSLAPLLMLIIWVAGAVFGQNVANSHIIGEIRVLVGKQGADVAQTVIQHAAGPERGSLALVIGIVTLLLGATGVFSELKSALNRIWDVEAQPQSAARGFVRTRLLSLAMVAGIGVLLLVSMVASAVLATVSAYMSQVVPGGLGTSWYMINIGVSVGVTTLLFAMIYKFLPDVVIAWSDVWVGALVTAILFTIGKTLIGLYLGYSTVGSVYGAAGSVVALVVWVYYSSLTVFLGAEFTQLYARRYGTRIQPGKRAHRLLDDSANGDEAGGTH